MKIYLSEKIDESSIEKINAIVLSGSDLNPPHIGLIILGRYFSCSVSSVITDVPFLRIFKNLKRRNHKIIFAEINISFSVERIKGLFLNHGVLNNEKTCLYPVKKSIESSLNLKFNSEFIFELLPLIEKLNLIEKYSHFGLDSEISNNYFTLNEYTKLDILDHIKFLTISHVRQH